MRRRPVTLALALTAVTATAPAAHATSLVDVQVRDRADARLVERLPGVVPIGAGRVGGPGETVAG